MSLRKKGEMKQNETKRGENVAINPRNLPITCYVLVYINIIIIYDVNNKITVF
jgi:hypothetical protein